MLERCLGRESSSALVVPRVPLFEGHATAALEKHAATARQASWRGSTLQETTLSWHYGQMIACSHAISASRQHT